MTTAFCCVEHKKILLFLQTEQNTWNQTFSGSGISRAEI